MNAAETHPHGEKPWRRLAASEAVHVTALGVWCGAVVMTGAAAAVAFPTMKELDPTLPAYAGYPGDHWSLAAGTVMAQVFTLADLVQLVAATLAGMTFLASVAFFRMPLRRPVNVLRGALLLATIGVLAFHLFSLAPRMNRAMRAYWDAAAAGNVETADRHKQTFDELHPQASTVLSATAAMTLALTGLGAWSAASRGSGQAPSRRDPSPAPKEPDASGPQEPLLARNL